MRNEIFKLERKVREDGEIDLSLSIPMDVLRTVLLANLSGNEFKVFIALATFMDDRGECNPSQETLGKLCNMSIPTVNKAINSLLGKEVGGFLLLKRELINKGSRKYSNYRIPLLGECDTTAGEEVSEEVVQKPMTSPDVLKLFEATYKETYGVPYKASYKKELGMIKRSLLPAYTDDQLRTIIKTVFEEYDKRWKTPKYQTPTIGALCSWLGNQALKLSADKEKAKAVVSKWDNLENSDEDLIL